MEHTNGISLKVIFLDNGNWWNFFCLHADKLRPAIIKNVLKMLACQTALLGYHTYTCPTCGFQKKVYHTCKSKFCSSCGKKATDRWMKEKFSNFPATKWQHITFTLPSELWNFFWFNRKLIGMIPPLAAGIILAIAEKKLALPAIYLAIHTFGRDLKRNLHFHLTTTNGGINIYNHNEWIKGIFYYHETIKAQWRYAIINLLREQYEAGNIAMPSNYAHIKNYKQFNKFLDTLYKKNWVVHLQNSTTDHKRNIEYLGRYMMRPPISEARITEYKDGMVTYTYMDHYDKETKSLTVEVMTFIGYVVRHIHDDNFRSIRYYGLLANRVIGKLLPLAHKLLKSKSVIIKKVKLFWRDMIIKAFGYDPLKCIKCGTIMLLELITLPLKIALTDLHEITAHGAFE